jgi:DNA-binding Lrp family transcriptional regulator
MAVQNITEEILKVLYVDLELTTKKIGKILGCNRTTILRYLKKYDIIIRKHVVESKQITVPELDKELAYFYGMLQGNGYVHVPSKSSPSGIVGISCGENLLLVDKVLEQLKRFNVA